MTTTKRGPLTMVRPHFRDLVPYVPIVPSDVLARLEGRSPGDIIKLDGNENPYGPSPRAVEAVRSLDALHIYPDPEQRELRPMLAAYVGVPAGHVIPGNGSDEIIDLLMRLFLDSGDVVINCSPSFGMYPFNTQVCAGTLVEVPRSEQFGLDLEIIAQRAADPRAKLIFLASPNNPTGNPLSPEELASVLDTGLVVVVDEAYQEFSAAPSFTTLVPAHENLVVLRTFSKWAGLAGLRVGYGVMAPSLVRLLDQIKPPYNVNVAALAAAQASLTDKAYLLERVGWMVSERARMFSKLRGVSYLNPLPSQANFILCRVQRKDGAAIKKHMEQRGIYIKHIDDAYLPNSLRISVGKPEHTDAVFAALHEL